MRGPLPRGFAASTKARTRDLCLSDPSPFPLVRTLLVKLGDNSSLDVMGKSIVRMLGNGFVLIISGVFYVPGIKNMLDLFILIF